MNRRLVYGTFLAGLSAACVYPAHGQSFPIKPVRIVVSGPGGSGDFSARLIAQQLSVPLGQQVIVENRPSGVIPAEVVGKSPADGYTLLLAGNSLWMAPLLQETSYDPLRDFAPVSQVCRIPNLIVVHPSLPVKSVKDLTALARANPGKLNYGAGGSGSAGHLAAELFKAMAGVDIVRVLYKGVAPALSALVSGEVQVTFPTIGSTMPYIKSGRLRALAVATAQPSALVPDLPTVSATGLPGFESVAAYGVFAPAKTPDAVIGRVHQEVARLLDAPEVRARFLGAGVEPAPSTPAQLTMVMKSEIAQLGKLIRDRGIRGE